MNPTLIVAAIQGLSQVTQLVANIIKERRRQGELTVEEEATWDAYVAQRMLLEHWHLDAKE